MPENEKGDVFLRHSVVIDGS